jgi:hypothetical protein
MIHQAVDIAENAPRKADSRVRRGQFAFLALLPGRRRQLRFPLSAQRRHRGRSEEDGGEAAAERQGALSQSGHVSGLNGGFKRMKSR